jgi:hypothetical protein
LFSSYAISFFDGDFAAAHAYNPVVERYVPRWRLPAPAGDPFNSTSLR